MKSVSLLGAMLLIALLITACGSAPAVTGIPTQAHPLATAIVGTATSLASEPAATEANTATEAPAATASPAVVSTQAATATSGASVPVTGETTIKATLSEDFGPILATADGNTLYIYKGDTPNSGKSACTDADCTANWTPLKTQGAPIAGAGVVQKLLGTITREDGTMQVTYNGWPLYTYNADTGAGSTSGQGSENKWYVVAPSGKAITK